MKTWWDTFVRLMRLPAPEMADLLPGLDLFRVNERPRDTGKAGELNEAIGTLMHFTSGCTARIERLEYELFCKKSENLKLTAELRRLEWQMVAASRRRGLSKMSAALLS